MFKFFKKKKEVEQPKKVYNLKNSLREFIFDSQIKEGNQMSVAMGCPPISPELQEKEEEESDKRVAKIAFLIPILHQHSMILSKGIAHTYGDLFGQDTEIEYSEEVLEAVESVLKQITLATLLGSISQLVNLGLLQLPTKDSIKELTFE